MPSARPDAAVWTLLIDGLDALLDGRGPMPAAGGSLARILARARHGRLPVAGRCALIAWSLTGDVDAVRRWPPGPVLYRSAAGREPSPGIMCADPVSLIPSGDRLLARGPRAVGLSAAETDTLTTALQRGFDGSDASFSVFEGQWFLEFEEPPSVQWWEPDQIAGQDLMPFMPAGSSARLVRTVMTEAQMLLHDHPINVARSARGQLAANGLWPWGWSTSRLPPTDWAPPALHGEDRYAHALTALAGASTRRTEPLSAHGCALVVLDLPGDDAALVPALERLDVCWCQPLLEALGRGRIERLRLVTPAGRCCELRRLDLLRFWRRWRP